MAIPLRLLVVEDSEDDALLVTHELQRGGFAPAWERVETREAMQEALDRGPWDLIISDFRMPHFSATDALALYRERGIDTPFLLVSGTIGEEQAVASLKAGVHDFIVKDRLTRLCPAVERELREAENRRARRKAESEREESRAALARSERRLARLIEFAPDAMVISRASGEIILVNAETERLFGFRRDELLGHPIEMLLPDRADAIGAGQDAIGRRKDGTSFPVEIAFSPLDTDEGGLVSSAIRDVGERRRLEETLRESERFAHAALDTLPAAVAILDPDARIIATNRSWRDFAAANGADPALVGNANYLAVCDRSAKNGCEDAVVVAAQLRGLIGGGPAFSIEYACDSPTQDRWFVCHASRFPGTGPVRVVVLHQDVTPLKQSQVLLRQSAEALRQNELRLSVALSAIDMAVFNQNADLVYQWMFHPQMGLLPEQVVGRTDAELLPAEAARQATEIKRRALNTGAAARGEISVRLGERALHYDIVVEPLRDAAGALVGLTGASLDITARKLAEAAVLKEKAFSEALLDSLPGVFALLEDTGRLLRWNRAFETVSGYGPEAIASMRPWDFVSSEDRTLLETTLQRVFDTGMGDTEAALRARDGSRTPYYFVGVRILVDGVPCCIVTGIDITARKLLEAQLQQAQKIEAIGRLAGGVAHDFNNILGVIIGYGEMARRQLGPAHPADARVEQMLKAAERAAGLTRQLLAFSRKQVLKPKLLDLNVVVAETHKMLGRLIGEDVTVVVHPATALGSVMADPGQVEQIILNLAVNARDAMPRGGSLTLGTANVELGADYAVAHPSVVPGRYVRLAVSDTGTGMDPETMSRIFEPFFTTKPEGEGTGLGLATVYGIVKQSGGSIWVDSEPGRGTTFEIYLPRVDQPTRTGAADTEPAPAPGGHETILLVEDTETLREVIRETLEESGYTVVMASNGEDALALARRHPSPIDLLLTDVVMPKLGGADLGKLLSALRPGLRILYMSGYTNGTISQHGVLGEAVLLLEKPFTADKLAHAVREALDRPRP